MKLVYKVKPFHRDERGEISHLLDKEVPFTSAVLITSKKDSIRANHYHKKDTHYCYMIVGKMKYTYKKFKIHPFGKLRARNSKLKTIIVNEGEVVVTPPMTEHAMKFLKDSVFLALTTEPREQKKYERDTVRVKLIR